MSTPQKLEKWRRRNSLTLAAAGGAVGVSHPCWSAWEDGSRCPALDKALRLELLTGGEIRIEHWGFDASVRRDMAAVLALKVAA